MKIIKFILIEAIILSSTILMVTVSAVNTFSAQEVDFAIITGKNLAFAVKLPSGWVSDEEIARQSGLGGFFYPNNQKDQTVYMHATGHAKVDLRSPDIKDFIKADHENFSGEADVKIKQLANLPTNDTTKAHVYEFQFTKEHKKEYVAYIDTKTAVCVLVLACQDNTESSKYFNDYKGFFVRSFKYLGDDPEYAVRVYKDFMKKINQSKAVKK